MNFQREPDLTPNALAILESRYLKRNVDGTPAETPADMFARVAKNIGAAETVGTVATFYDMMVNLEFLPNSPALRGAGRKLQQLFGCYVLPIGDSLEEIFDALKGSALIHKSGGGVGFSFSSLRPRGDTVSSTGNVAGGPVSFMRVFNTTAQEVTQGGVRMGANMAVLRVDHPDILEFISCKDDGANLQNFNISVAITDEFMTAYENDDEYPLVNPRTQEPTGTKLEAREVLERIAQSAWKSGDPGVLFIDRINRGHPVPSLGTIEATNPCGEQPLLPYESCCLGSINLAKMVSGNEIRWGFLEGTVAYAVRFLDDAIDVNKYPLPQIEATTKNARKIGLGVMGFADMLIQLGIPYGSERALEIADEVMGFISTCATGASVRLGDERGFYPAYEEGMPARRNAAITTVAPTGTLGVIADCSHGIEPCFAMVYQRHTLFNNEGSTKTLQVVNKYLEQALREEGLYTPDVVKQIADTGSVQEVKSIPQAIRRVFVTAHDILPEWHVKMQAAFQKHVHAAISKTINFPNQATQEDVKSAYLLAYQQGCKGITVYRDGCRSIQVIDVGTKKSKPEVQPRAPALRGTTHKKRTPLGTVYVTVNEDEAAQPLEVFVNVGKAGSDISAVAEALGRLISLILRLPSSLSRCKRLSMVAEQLSGIGGRQSLGLGPARVRSLPDGIAQALGNSTPESSVRELGDLCPECGQATLVAQEGCNKCASCGFSEC